MLTLEKFLPIKYGKIQKLGKEAVKGFFKKVKS